ncbi:Rrf2 family transcriptional regulator [bacterium]|nr:Rrf2 family transcriptional regulator [bacterium]
MSRVLNISDAAILAFHALVYCAGHTDRTVSLREIATEYRVSEAHLSKVMQRLVKAGFVKSTRGPGGGFMLDNDPGAISMLEIYELFEGPLSTSSCLFETPVCSFDTCVFGALLDELNTTVRKYLTTTKLSDIAHAKPKVKG